MSKRSSHSRRAAQYRVEHKKLAVDKKVSENLSEPRTEASPEAVRLGIRDKKPGAVGALSPFLQRNLTGRSIDISPGALKGRTHRGVGKGGITHQEPKKVKRYKRFSYGRKSHLLEEVLGMDNQVFASPIRDEALPDKQQFTIIRPGTKLGKLLGLKDDDKPLFIPKSGPENDSFTVRQGTKILNKGKLK